MVSPCFQLRNYTQKTAREALAEADNRIRTTASGPLSLNPHHTTPARTLVEIVDDLVEGIEQTWLTICVSRIVHAQLDHFPGNLLWDFDYMLASIHRNASRSASYFEFVHTMSDLLVDLMGIYGQHSKIRFRYVHDFLYGFDWARWVRQDPTTRSQVLPFDIEFIHHSKQRGLTMQHMIKSRNPYYPILQGDQMRNPFPFGREPKDELRLWRELASEDDIPVTAWNQCATFVWNRDFDRLRLETAARLGITKTKPVISPTR